MLPLRDALAASVAVSLRSLAGQGRSCPWRGSAAFPKRLSRQQPLLARTCARPSAEHSAARTGSSLHLSFSAASVPLFIRLPGPTPSFAGPVRHNSVASGLPDVQNSTITVGEALQMEYRYGRGIYTRKRLCL